MAATALSTPTSRRAMLTAAAAVPALAVIGATMAQAAPATDKTRWNALVATVERCAAVLEQCRIADDAAQKLHDAARRRIGKRPAKPTIKFPRPINEMTVGEISGYDITPEQTAAYEADLAAWTLRDDEIARRTGIDATYPAWESALTAHGEAAGELLAYPAPDAEALLYKVKVAEAEWQGFDLCQDVKGHLFADIRRLVGGEG